MSEIYGELLVPVTERLELEFGYRYSDYDNLADPVGTYGVQFSWRATDWLRIRARLQSASRAPNTAELFQAETAVFQTTFSSGDPCGVNTLIPGYGNRPDAANRLQVQQLCAQLIGNTTSTFGAPGSVEANSYQAGTTGVHRHQHRPGRQPGRGGGASGDLDLRLRVHGAGRARRPDRIARLLQHRDHDAIATFDGQTIYNKCFNRDGVSNPG